VVQNRNSDDYPLMVMVNDTLTFGEKVDVPADLVVLATGMEPTGISELVDLMKLPVGTDRFLLEVHPKLRPVELPQAGILLAGTCQAPMDVGEACNGAGGQRSRRRQYWAAAMWSWTRSLPKSTGPNAMEAAPAWMPVWSKAPCTWWKRRSTAVWSGTPK
jgi:heterodisulfide reductase subunit A-like polyferredoxin